MAETTIRIENARGEIVMLCRMIHKTVAITREVIEGAEFFSVWTIVGPRGYHWREHDTYKRAMRDAMERLARYIP